MDFLSLPARRGSCPTRLEIDADNVQAVMVDMERVWLDSGSV